MSPRIRYKILGSRAFRKGFLREVIFPVLIGISIGFSFGQISFLRPQEDFHHNDIYTQQISLDDYESPDGSIFFLRCVVLVHSDAKRPLSFIMAIRDTYGRQCNQTVFYTNSVEIHKKVNDQRIFLVDSASNAFHWSYFSHVVRHSHDVPAQWTIFVDEQVFLRVPNLRRALTNFNPKDSVILGRILTSKGSFFFPMVEHERMSLQAGIVMSQSAVKTIGNCTDSFWSGSTEKMLISCAKERGIDIVDPVDEENMHLFHYLDLKTIIPQAMEKGGHSCCSDHAISFGQQSHKEIRMAHFAADKWAVFGVDGTEDVNATFAIERSKLIRLTTTRKPTTTTTKAPKTTKKKAKPGLL